MACELARDVVRVGDGNEGNEEEEGKESNRTELHCRFEC